MSTNNRSQVQTQLFSDLLFGQRWLWHLKSKSIIKPTTKFPGVSQFCLKEWQDIWNCCEGNKLHAIYPNVRKRLQAVIRRGIRSGLCEQHHKTVEELVEEADDKLFTNVMYNKQHVLHSTLPGTMDTKYHLRPRPHNFKLTAKNSCITECDFITRMLFKDVYWHSWHHVLIIAILCIDIPI